MSRNFAERDVKDAALAVYYHAAQLLKAGRSPQEVEALLVEQGIKPETARKMLTKLGTAQIKVARRMGGRNVAFGAALMLLGLLLVTGVTSGRPAEGLSAILGWLSVVIGAAWCARGAWQYTRRWIKA